MAPQSIRSRTGLCPEKSGVVQRVPIESDHQGINLQIILRTHQAGHSLGDGIVPRLPNE
jgi:hypothetical protein